MHSSLAHKSILLFLLVVLLGWRDVPLSLILVLLRNGRGQSKSARASPCQHGPNAEHLHLLVDLEIHVAIT